MADQSDFASLLTPEVLDRSLRLACARYGLDPAAALADPGSMPADVRGVAELLRSPSARRGAAKAVARDAGGGVDEEEATRLIVKAAHESGWVVAHFRRALTQRGAWTTPVQYDAKGFPDLVLVRPGRRVLWREVKVGRNTTTPEQDWWLALLTDAGEDAGVWRWPGDRERITAELA
jgi:hypothetical protein